MVVLTTHPLFDDRFCCYVSVSRFFISIRGKINVIIYFNDGMDRDKIFATDVRLLTQVVPSCRCCSNRRFPSSLQPPFQIQAKCEVFVMKICFFHIEIGTNYHNKKFALRLALKERLRGTRKRPIGHFGKYHNTLCLSPHILHKHCFQFLLGLKMAPREIKNNAYAKFGGTNKEYYGIFRTGLLHGKEK